MWHPYVDKEFLKWAPRTITISNGGHGIYFPGDDRVAPLGFQFYTTLPPERAAEGRWITAAPTGARYDTPLVGSGDGYQRVREMDRDGIDADVLFPAVFGGRAIKSIPREAHAALCRGYNDWLTQEYTAADPERLWGLALIPPYVEDAIEEMRRVNGMPGIYATAGWPETDDPEDDRFWEAAIELDMPLTTHGLGSPPPVDWPPPAKRDELVVVGQPVVGSGLAAINGVKFILSGLLDRLPSLHIFFAETGVGWLPFTYEALDRLWEQSHLWSNAELSKPPSQYWKDHFHYSFMVDRFGIEHRHEIGITQIMWSTDFPHMNSNWPESVDLIEREFEGVPEDEVRLMVCDNALNYFHVREAVAA
jgi:predicted TIM-barrel fold metal-dependent hydrolase